ncbi:MAG TPA: sigma-70 family RNA polymerase sigma factor [Euzebyales bacterium]|nr:sigma-70 family RNA polymerase sigma factor [Euzebyales bacterium]
MTASRDTAPLPPDPELVAGLRARDEAAFALVVDVWSPGMLRLARGFVSTDASAAEVVQEAWLAVIDGIFRFEGRASLKTWVYRILVNTAKRRGARERRSVPWSSLAAAEDRGPTVDPAQFQGRGEPFPGHWRQPPAPWPLPEQHTLSAELRDELAAALSALPARQRVVITLRDVEGYSSAEASEILDISAANQRVLLHRARASVRHRLDAYFAAAGAPSRLGSREVTS